MGHSGYGKHFLSGLTAPEQLSLKHSRWISSLELHFLQHLLTEVTKHMLCSDKVCSLSKLKMFIYMHLKISLSIPKGRTFSTHTCLKSAFAPLI